MGDTTDDDPEEVTTIAIRKHTRDRIAKHGNKGDTYDEILEEILNRYEGQDGGP